MDLYLRKVIHPQAHENYRVILKLDDGSRQEAPIPASAAFIGSGETTMSPLYGESMSTMTRTAAAIATGPDR